jgi:hypothetical protein
MAQDDDNMAPSQRRIVTQREQRIRIERSLQEVTRRLDTMQRDEALERLKLSLDAFRRIVDSWRTHPPTDALLAIIRERLDAMLETPTSTKPTLKMRRSA